MSRTAHHGTHRIMGSPPPPMLEPVHSKSHEETLHCHAQERNRIMGSSPVLLPHRVYGNRDDKVALETGRQRAHEASALDREIKIGSDRMDSATEVRNEVPSAVSRGGGARCLEASWVDSSSTGEGAEAAVQGGSPQDRTKLPSQVNSGQVHPVENGDAAAQGVAKTWGPGRQKFGHESSIGGLVKLGSGPFMDAGRARDWVLSRESLEAIENAGYEVEWSV